jgi:hypothetical protein
MVMLTFSLIGSKTLRVQGTRLSLRSPSLSALMSSQKKSKFNNIGHSGERRNPFISECSGPRRPPG